MNPMVDRWTFNVVESEVPGGFVVRHLVENGESEAVCGHRLSVARSR